MAWETRNGRGRYYTRSKRVKGRVVREYVGSGLIGEMAAVQDAERRAEREKQRSAWMSQRQEMEAIEGLVGDRRKALAALTGATLLQAGFHRHHRGEWRKRIDR